MYFWNTARALGALAIISILLSAVAFLLWRNGPISFSSADEAYFEGERYFSALTPEAYDIEKAEFFFKQALAMNPKLPLVRHQLARIAFLKGDFNNALWLINRELELGPEPIASTYYVRALILGFMGRYEEAAEDYAIFTKLEPKSWAGANDYSWILLKLSRFSEAAKAAEQGLKTWPDSPWLLNSHATALYEMGEIEKARKVGIAALKAAANVSENQWLLSYPGNDPAVAAEGILALQDSILSNVHTILVAANKAGL